MTSSSAPTAVDPDRAGTLLAEATAVGLVSRQEVASGSVNLRIVQTATGVVHALLVRDRAVAYVKSADPSPSPSLGPALSPVRGLGHEQQVLTALAPRQIGPRVLGGAGPTLWFAALTGTDLAHQPADVVELAETCQAWGAALADLHTTPLGAVAPMARRPGLPVDGPGVARQMSGARGAVLRALSSDRLLRGLVTGFADRWSPTCWVHGDLTGSHVVVDRSSGVQVRFLDFAGSGIGDPAWDVASALETIALLAAGWQVPAETLEDYFLRGYRRAGGPGRVDAGYRALRAGLTAWRIATRETPGVLTAESVGVLRQVVSWLARSRDLAVRAAGGASTWR